MSIQRISESEKFQNRIAERVEDSFYKLRGAAMEAERLAKMCPKECVKHYRVIEEIGQSFLSMSELLKAYCNNLEQENL